MFKFEESIQKIKIIGIGGGGINVLNRLIAEKISGVEFIAVDVDEKSLSNSKAENKIKIDEQAAQNVFNCLENSDMVLLVAGIGGNTATTAVSTIAKAAKKLDALTLAVVSAPLKLKSEAISRELGNLRDCSDMVIAVHSGDPEEKSFVSADNFMCHSIKGILQLVTNPGIVNLDLEDIQTIVKDAGFATVGIGEASGTNSIQNAAKAALGTPFLHLGNARSILINIMGSDEALPMSEVNEATITIQEATAPDAEIMWGMSVDENLGDTVRVTIIATRF